MKSIYKSQIKSIYLGKEIVCNDKLKEEDVECDVGLNNINGHNNNDKKFFF